MITGTIDYLPQDPPRTQYRCRVRTPNVYATTYGRSRMEAISKALAVLGLPLDSD